MQHVVSARYWGHALIFFIFYFSLQEELGGCMACSTWFPRGIVDTPSPANAKLPVMLCHGEVDPIAKVEWSSKVFFSFFPRNVVSR